LRDCTDNDCAGSAPDIVDCGGASFFMIPIGIALSINVYLAAVRRTKPGTGLAGTLLCYVQFIVNFRCRPHNRRVSRPRDVSKMDFSRCCRNMLRNGGFSL